MEKLYEIFAKVLAATALIVATVMLWSVVLAFPLKWAWNASVVEIFGWKEIGFFQSMSLLWVASLLIKGSPTKGEKG